MVVFLRVVLLVIGEKVVQLQALLKVLSGLQASNILQELEVSESVSASADKSVPVHALELNVSIVFLEREVQCLAEIDVRALDCVHVLTCHLELVEVEVFGEDLHYL